MLSGLLRMKTCALLIYFNLAIAVLAISQVNHDTDSLGQLIDEKNVNFKELKVNEIAEVENGPDEIMEQKDISNKISPLKNELDSASNHLNVFSLNKLKLYFDSLGISKLDTLKALQISKQKMSDEDLLKAINTSFDKPSTPELPYNQKDLMRQEMPDAPDLSPDQLTNAVQTPELPEVDLSKYSLPKESLKELAPLRSYKFPADSLLMIDSLRRLNLEKDKMLMKQEQVTDKIKKATVLPKPNFFDRSFWEGHIGYLELDDYKTLQFAPTFGQYLAEKFSVGLGPNITIQERDRTWQILWGYRAFAKYEFIPQRVYAQSEYVVDPIPSGGNETTKRRRNSALLGAGYVHPLSGKLGINFSLLYRVKQSSPEYNSPWLFRVGLSSFKSGQK
jgi:hypothetical protein